MVIFRITKGMSEREYLEYSKRIVQQYEWGKNNDNCLVVPEYVEVYVVNNKQVCVEDSGADLSWLLGKENPVKISEGNYDSDEEYEEQTRCLDETN